MEIRIDSGINPQYIRSFVENELACARDATGDYVYGNCRVSLRPQAGRMLGHVVLPRTDVVIFGSEADCKAFERAYTLRFLSAGA